MTCRIGLNSSRALAASLRGRPRSIRTVEISAASSIDLEQRHCPNCAGAMMRPISTADHVQPGLDVYQCDDCLGMTRFIVKEHSNSAADRVEMAPTSATVSRNLEI